MDFSIRPKEGGKTFNVTSEQARLAERLGFDGVYLAEHSGLDGPYWPNPLLGLAGIATETSCIKLGTSILQLPLYNPVKLANSLAFLDAISDGRLICGIGVGWRTLEFDAHGVPVTRRGELTTQYLSVLKALFQDDPELAQTDKFDIEEFTLSPAPVQRPHPPILVGGWSGAAIDRAVNFGDGWLSPGGPLQKNLNFIDDFVASGGETVILGTNGTVIRKDKQDAVAATHEFLKRRMMFHRRVGNERQYAEFNEHLNSQGLATEVSTTAELERYAEEYVDYLLRDGLNSYLSDNLFIAGTPDECIEQIEGIIDKTGCSEIIFRLHADGISAMASMRTLRLLGEDVLPSF